MTPFSTSRPKGGNVWRLTTLIGSAAFVGLGGLLIWRECFFNPTCSRTPMTEISGNPLLKDLLVPSVFLIRFVAEKCQAFLSKGNRQFREIGAVAHRRSE
jgi:hypothetical protein